jgi:ribosomal protein L32
MRNKPTSGKGSMPRPFSVSIDDYGNKWDLAFGRPKQKKVKPKQEKPVKLPKNTVCPHCAKVFDRQERYCPQCGYSN